MVHFKLSPSEIVSGTAWGVDACGEAWAVLRQVKLTTFPADWDKYGKAAGPKRNQQMADYADALLLVWDGVSKGSRNMLSEMERRKKPVYAVVVQGESK